MNQKCPDFELAPLEKFDPRIFTPRNDFERRLKPFMLSLALLFNDFKGFEWWLLQTPKSLLCGRLELGAAQKHPCWGPFEMGSRYIRRDEK